MIDIVTTEHANIDREFIDEAIKAHLDKYTPIKRHMVNSIHVDKDGGFIKFCRWNDEPGEAEEAAQGSGQNSSATPAQQPHECH